MENSPPSVPPQPLWAPWRLPYLESNDRPAGCFLCEIGAGTDEAGQRLVVWRGEHLYVLLNAYPYASGHLMVTPYGHVGRLENLTDGALAEIMPATRRMIRALREAYSPEGFNVGFNIGEAAGAGFGDHLHLHVVPRWSGDTNFMTTTASTRVLPEDLGATAERVRAALDRIASAGDA